jgi:hypothetical protein
MGGGETSVGDMVSYWKKDYFNIPLATTTNHNPNQPCFHYKVYGHGVGHCFTLHP